jgi:serine/threonine-protein kinase
MGSVYRARRSDGTIVALKVMRPELRGNTAAEERFRRAPTLYPVHPNIVEIYDAGECNNTLYFAMRLIQGESLAEVMRLVHSLAPEQYLPILRDVSAALDAAHARGIIHRDIKPSNILVEASNGRAILTDFDIAKEVGSNFTTVGSTGQPIGTAQYMSPEQAAGKPITPASDVYALGAMTYEILAGRAPFIGENDFVVARMHLQDTPADLHKVNPSIPASVSAVVMRALRKAPRQRYASAGGFAKAYADALGQRVSVPLGMPVKIAIGAGLAALLLIGFVAIFALSSASGGDTNSTNQASATSALGQVVNTPVPPGASNTPVNLTPANTEQADLSPTPAPVASETGVTQSTPTTEVNVTVANVTVSAGEDTATAAAAAAAPPPATLAPIPTGTATRAPTRTPRPTKTPTSTPTLTPTAPPTPTPAVTPTAFIVRVTVVIVRPPILVLPTPTPTPTPLIIKPPIRLTRIVINP